MKDFFLTFFIVLVLIFVFLFFGGAILLEHFWLSVIATSFLISLLVFILIRFSDKIENLEKRMEKIESEKKDA